MKKYLAIMLAAVLLLCNCFSVVAFATEGDSVDPEISSGTDVVDNPDSVDPESSGGDDGGEGSAEAGSGSESGSGTDVGDTPTELEPEVEPPTIIPTTPSLDGATVNVSQESIDAIADAVATVNDTGYDYQYVLTGSNGITYTINCNEPSLLTDYYVYLGYSGSTGKDTILLSQEPLYWAFRTGITDQIFCDAKYVPYKVTYLNTVTSFDTYSGLSQLTVNRMSPFYWTNIHIFDEKSGTLYYESTYVPPVTYSVSFNTGFDDLTVESVSVENGGTIVAPVLEYDGYRFDGWYLDEEFTLPYTSDFTFIADTTLYAKWTKYVTVSFVSNIEDYELDSVQVLSGEAYTPPDFAYSGYNYLGVYTDEDYKTPFVGGTVVDDDITLYLRLEPIVYDVGSLLIQLNDNIGIIQSQLWIILVVGLLGYVYKFFRIFF